MLSCVCDEEECTEADVGLLLAIFLSSLSLSSTNDLDLSCQNSGHNFSAAFSVVYLTPVYISVNMHLCVFVPCVHGFTLEIVPLTAAMSLWCVDAMEQEKVRGDSEESLCSACLSAWS